MTTAAPDTTTMRGMTSTTDSRPVSNRSTSTATKVNALAMAIAIAAIISQIAVGVDYPTVPPGPIILGVAVMVVLFVRATWARIVGVAVPLFLIVGGTIASIANDDNALRVPGDASPFIATVLQLAAVAVALVAGIAAFRDRRS
jgi:hypothetical protein